MHTNQLLMLCWMSFKLDGNVAEKPMTPKRISTFVGATLFTALLVASTAAAGDLNAGASQP